MNTNLNIVRGATHTVDAPDVLPSRTNGLGHSTYTLIIIKQNKKWPPAGPALRRRHAETLRPVQLQVCTALQEVVDIHLHHNDPFEPGEVQHCLPMNRHARGLREAGVDSPEVHPSAQTGGGQCSSGATVDPRPHQRPDGLGEGMELVHLHGCLRLHHTEDSECAVLQGLTLVLHLAEAAL